MTPPSTRAHAFPASAAPRFAAAPALAAYTPPFPFAEAAPQGFLGDLFDDVTEGPKRVLTYVGGGALVLLGAYLVYLGRAK